MNTRLFLVDVESTGPSPANSVMTEFGVVDYETREWFHGHIWDSVPDREIPALPVATEYNPGFTATLPILPDSHSTQGFDGKRYNNDSMKVVMLALTQWIDWFSGVDRPVFVSDNPGFDFMWIAFEFDKAERTNVFGHSSRRIGDFAAGLAGNWKQQTKWKSLRKTRHTHNPVDDAMGNAEALEALLILATD